MNPPFGTLNGSVAKAILENAPRYRRIVEPFADGGTFALTIGKPQATGHVVNVVDPMRSAALRFAQAAKGTDLRYLKSLDWTASAETFEAVLAIDAAEGPDVFYRMMYLKKFGIKIDPDLPPVFDPLAAGHDASRVIYGLPLMKIGLKRATITSDDPLSLVKNDSETFLILLPKTPEDVDAVRSRLAGLAGPFFFAAKVRNAFDVIEQAGEMAPLNVAALPAPSIMMGTLAAAWNYDAKLKPLDPDALKEAA